jgi:hypothetical protein
MAGTVTITRTPLKSANDTYFEKVVIDWVADASAATVPNTTVSGLYGFLLKAITNPGSTAPTANYDIAFGDPEDTTLDALGGLLQNRHTSNTEAVYGIAKNGTDVAPFPIFLAGDYQFQLTNNAVNSATGRVILYLSESI